MSETTSNPGTPPDETADAPQGVSESVEGEVREAAQDEKERTDWKAMALGLKATLEERNRREQERQPEPQGLGSYTSPTDAQVAQTQAEIVRLRAAYINAQQGAAAGDDRDLLLLKILEDQMATKQELLLQQQLGRIEPSRRDKVWEHFTKNRHRLNTVDAADLELDGIEYRSMKADLEQKKKDAEAVVKAKTEGVQGTFGSREVTATEAKVRKMTPQQFDNEISRLRAEGKDQEALKLMGLVRNRKVILTG